VWEGIEDGKWVWYRFGVPLLFIAMAIASFADMQRERKRAELGASTEPARDNGSGNS
jgi:hypothetical protein